MTLTRSAILEASLAAAKKWLSVEYSRYSGKKLPILMAPSADAFRQWSRMKVHDGKPDEENGEVINPFALWAVGSIGLDAEKAGLRQRRAGNGVQTGLDVFHGTARFDTMRPVILGLGCAFVTTDWEEVILFAEAVLNAAPAITLVVSSESGFLTETTLKIEPDLTIPPPDSELGSTYRFETTLQLRTYIGTHSEQKIIRKLRVEVLDARSSTSLGYSSKASPGVVFDDDYDSLLKEQIRYQDLFDKASKHYKYDYNKEVDP